MAVAVEQRRDEQPRPDERTGLVRHLRHRITELNRRLRDEYDRGFADGQADIRMTAKARKLAVTLGLAARIGEAFRKLHPHDEPTSEAIAQFAEAELGLSVQIAEEPESGADAPALGSIPTESEDAPDADDSEPGDDGDEAA